MTGESVFSSAERDRRLAATRAAMDAAGFDGLLLFAGGEIPQFAGDVVYLTGYVPIFEHAWCVVTADSCDLVLPKWEWPHTNGAAWLDPSHIHRDLQRVTASRGGVDVCERLLADAARIGVCSTTTMPLWLWRELRAMERSDRLVEASVLEPMRRIKSAEEVDAIRAASAITDAGVRAFFDAVERGVPTEIEIAGEIEQAMRAAGVERFAIPVVLGAGVGSLDVAVQPTARRVEPGDMVLLDCAARHHGYISDTARGAVSGGDPSPEQRRLLDVTVEMYQEGLALLRPGVDVRAPHRIAVEVAASHGYEYLHETGHSVGCDPHEPPWIDEGDHEEVFAAGMVVAIEPGLYYEGLGGCRIENTILITEDGPVEISEAPLKNW